MKTNRTPPAADPIRWGFIFGMLSLDATRPYLWPMGVVVQDPAKFVDELRAEIRRARELETANAETAARGFEPAVFGRLAAAFGEEFARYVRAWGTDVFQFGGTDGADAFIWRNLVLRGGLMGERDVAPPPPFVARVRSVLARFPPVPPSSYVLPLTDWDQQFYARHQYDLDNNPFDAITNTADHFRFISAWERECETELPNQEDLYHWGLGEAAKLNIPTRLVVPPGNWPPPPTAPGVPS